MARIGKARLSDAIPKPQPAAGRKGGKPAPTHDATAEATREANESAQARNAEASIRARMVQIGRGNQQAGRQGT
jgi:hypothetical protein